MGPVEPGTRKPFAATRRGPRLLEMLLAAVYAAREGPPRIDPPTQHAPLLKKLRTVGEQHQHSADKIDTCHQRGHSPWRYLELAIADRRAGRPLAVLRR